MTKANYSILLDKSIEAALSAIELYNKPNFSYREESFSILMINAWELLLKAKILKDNNGNLKTLYITTNKIKKDGTKSKQVIYKLNRAKNYCTIGIDKLLSKIELDSNLKKNLEILIEIRDNSIHFINRKSRLFEEYTLETAIASLKNYSILINEWFNRSLEEFNLSLIPIAFNLPQTFKLETLKKETVSNKNLLEYILNQRKDINHDSKYDITVLINLKVERNKEGIAVKFDKNGIPIKIEAEEDLKNKFPLDYNSLIEKCKKRYKNFKITNNFHRIRKKICDENKNLKNTRYLDNIRNKGIKKDFYSSNIIKELDKYYIKNEN